MSISLRPLSIALLSAGCCFAGSALAQQQPYYNPSNTGVSGKTTGYELYKTIGCPGRQLFDAPCADDVQAAKPTMPRAVAAPAPLGMPNARPGECYAKVIQEPVYRTEQSKKLLKEAGERIEIVPPVYKAVKVQVTSEEVQEVVPAVYEKVKERVMVKPATTRLVPVDAVYETVQEKVLSKPATKRAIDVPAVYEDVTERKLVREAYTTWKKGTATNIQKIDEKTGEIMCLVEVPAEYQNVTNRVLKTPATVRYEETPAEYGTISKIVLKTPATTRTVEVPAEYAERETTKLVKPATTVSKVVPVNYMREIMTQVQPATEKRVAIPAEYTAVEEKVLVSAGQESWSQILCDVNATPSKIGELQRALTSAGFNAGSSGSLDAQTMSAAAAYQKAKGLPMDGYMNIDTVKALGVSPK